jgi:copper chaperone CopZ
VRSALLSVKGVTRAQVRLESYEALVTYNPAVAKIDDMIKAVEAAEHPVQGRGIYKVTVKK